MSLMESIWSDKITRESWGIAGLPTISLRQASPCEHHVPRSCL